MLVMNRVELHTASLLLSFEHANASSRCPLDEANLTDRVRLFCHGHHTSNVTYNRSAFARARMTSNTAWPVHICPIFQLMLTYEKGFGRKTGVLLAGALAFQLPIDQPRDFLVGPMSFEDCTY